MARKAKASSIAPESQIISQEWGGLVSVSELNLHPDNAREGDVGAIYHSIEKNKFYGALLVQKSTHYVLAGNHRLKAGIEHRIEALPVIWIDCDDETARRILISDNRTADLASWNMPALADLLQSIQADMGTLEGTGFDGDALENLLHDLEASTGSTNGNGDGPGMAQKAVKCPACGNEFVPAA